MSQSKKAYFQGTEEPSPKKKKYKSDPALVNQPRFKEPLYRNYDLYDTPGEHSPGSGYHHLLEFKSVKDFLNDRRKKMKDKYKADDSWQLDNGTRVKKKARSNLLGRLIKVAIDFPIDDQISSPILGDSGTYSDSVPIGGQLDEYLTLPDFEGKSADQLDFARDYTEDDETEDDEKKEKGSSFLLNKKFLEKYLNPAEPSLFGLPDGISPPEDLDAPSNENPQYGITDSGNTIYNKI
jgi:hypothetical protein